MNGPDVSATRDRLVLLDGPPGVGKSTLGRALAVATARPFVDLDEHILSETGGASIAELFTTEGEAGFRAREARALRSFLETSMVAGPSPIVALGGGTLVDHQLRDEALSGSLVVGLELSTDALLTRLRASTIERPLLRASADAQGPASIDEARLTSLLASRRSAYERVHVRLDASPSVDALLEQLVPLVRDAPIPVGGFSRPQLVRVTSEPVGALALALRSLRPTSFAFVTDTTVAALHADRLLARLAECGLEPAVRIDLPPGEQQKRFETLERMLERFAESELDRGSVVVAMGGGVVSDVSGFAASPMRPGSEWMPAPLSKRRPPEIFLFSVRSLALPPVWFSSGWSSRKSILPSSAAGSAWPASC